MFSIQHVTSNLGFQLQFECFRIFNNVNQHNVPSRIVIKKHGTKSFVRTKLGTKTCGRCRLPPPDADRERARPAFQNSPALSVSRAPMPTIYKY
jgi:hypothetical protein